MKKSIALGIAFIMVVSGLIASAGNVSAFYQHEFSSGVPHEKALSSHEPIRINNDSDLSSMASSEGWQGDGSEANPYVIENYGINGDGDGYCIYVGNTTLHFIIKNSSFYNAKTGSSSSIQKPYFRDSAVYLYNVSGCGLINVSANNSGNGIFVDHSSYVWIVESNASSNSGSDILGDGITFFHSSHGRVINSTSNDNKRFGIYLSDSIDIRLYNNSMEGDGIFFWAHEYSTKHVEYFNTHDIPTNNTVNGKPVYYFKNQTGGAVPAGAGEVILANCTGMTVENQTLNGGSVGIELACSDGNRIVNNTVFRQNLDGMMLTLSSNNNISNNTVFSNKRDGIGAWHLCYNNTFYNNTVIKNAQFGFHLDSGESNAYDGNKIIKNTVGSNGNSGIFLSKSDSCEVSNNTMISDDVWLDHTHDVVVSGNEFKGTSEKAIWCEGDRDSLIFKNNISGSGYYCIYLDSLVYGDKIYDNTMSDKYSGIYSIQQSSNVAIYNNSIDNTAYYGIYLYSPNNPRIENNTISNTGTGTYLRSSNYAYLYGNEISADGVAVDLIYSKGAFIKYNRMSDSDIEIWGSDISYWNTHYIDTTNTVNGKPVYYIKDQDGGGAPGDGGEIIIAHCVNMSLSEITMSGNGHGSALLWIGVSKNISIENCDFSSAKYGVYAQYTGPISISDTYFSDVSWAVVVYDTSDGVRVLNNTVENCDFGIRLDHVDSGMVYGNYLYKVYYNIQVVYGKNNSVESNYIEKSNSKAIYLYHADKCTVHDNTVNGSSGNGTYLYHSSNNTIYHNNFIDCVAPYDDTGTNYWDNGYPDGGNYWSDYSGVDYYSGPGQNESGSDGIGDSSYLISGSGGAHDKYPLIFPYGSIPTYLGNTPWPMFRHDLWHSGISPYNSSKGAWVDWQFPDSPTGAEIRVSPAIGSDGTIYFGDYSGKFYAVNPDGTEKWNFTADDAITTSSPAIAQDGTIYFGTRGGTFYALNPNGTEKWNVSIGYEIWSSPAIDFDGTIYIGANNGHLYAFYPNGTEKWNFTSSSAIGSPAVSPDGTIIFAAYNNYTYALNRDGSLKWKVDLHANISAPPLILKGGEDYIVVVACKDGNVYGFYLNGTVARNLSIGAPVYAVPIFNDPYLYIADGNGVIHAFNTSNNLTEEWNYTTGGAIYSSPAIDASGNIYFGSNDKYVYSLSPKGNLLWKYDTGSIVRSSPAINDGYLYIGNSNGNLFAFGDTKSPDISITSPSDGAIFNTSSVTVEWTGSDDTSGIDHYEVRIDGGSWTNVGTNTSHDFTNLADGSHTVDVKAVDKAGNEATDSVTFTVNTSAPADTTPPSIEITSPNDGSIIYTDQVTVRWNAQDSDSGINHYEIRVDSGTWQNVGTETSHTFTNLSDGSHTVEVKAIDNAGNEKTASVSFNIDTSAPPDTTAPEITITSPEDGAEIDTDSITVTWRGSDSGSGINHYEVRLDGGKWKKVGTSTSYEFSSLSDGSHTVEVKAVDNAGNENTSSIHFTVSKGTPSGNLSGGNGGGDFIPWLALIIILLLVVLLIFAMKRRKKPENEEVPIEEENP